MKYIVTLNGNDYEVDVERGEAILQSVVPAAARAAVPAAAAPAPAAAAAPAPVAAPAPAAVPVGAGETVSAPMPGSILNVLVKPGDAVKTGQTLLTLEAMKMENEISAPHDGTVGQVLVAKGASVDTGAPLVTLV
ncbi:MAG: biotin/lipoyl-binding protein [Eubacteriales bacterium]|nr:biotin/lipoyl-binding protein [Eubacteriales bacterium]